MSLMSTLRPSDAPVSPEELVRELAREEFDLQYDSPTLAPVAVVIPSFGEEANVGSVVSAVPSTVCGLDVSVLVVVDGLLGPGDTTPKVVEEAGGLVSVMRAHMGQGVALRLGYMLAREHGARIIVTVDADGQYDLSQMEALVEPVAGGEADFVQGSRLMAGSRRGDLTRWVGVHVFAWVVTALTGHRITDSSNGFRAMRAEIPGVVPLTEDQYQTAELLIGTLGRGYRVTERPADMKPRLSGKTKKGGNVFFGANYARVIFKTYLRERWRARSAGRRFGTAG